MTPIETATIINIALTAITLTISYLNYNHSKKKNFQDKLFQIKLDAYTKLNAKCYDTYLALNINSHPFNQIYKIDTKNEWDEYFLKEITSLYSFGFDLQKDIYNYAHLLPNTVIDKYDEFSNNCLSFVTNSAHHDTELIVDSTDRLWGHYTDLLEMIRKDLQVDKIDKGLLKRISQPLS